LRIEPLIEDPPILAGSGNFFASLKLVHDLDGDGDGDVLLPTDAGLGVYLFDGSALSADPVDRIEFAPREGRGANRVHRWYPFPAVRDLDGDGLPDLLFGRSSERDSLAPVHVFRGTGEGRFAPWRDESLDCHDDLTDLRFAVAEEGDYPWPQNLDAVRDLDGDGRAELVTRVERERGDSMRKELKDAKKPIQWFRFHRMRDDRFVDPEPYFDMEAIGHTMGDDPDDDIPFWIEQFVDLDADGLEDLVTITLEFSVFQALKIMTTKKIGIGVDFHVYAQQPDGRFREVPGLDLSEKLKFNLNNLKFGRFAQFGGDFDGDGLLDFVHLGRGTRVTIHAGQPGCRFPKKPDLSIELEEEPPSLDLVRIEDLDGDGRSDIRITRPLPKTDVDTTAPVRLDLYVSGGGS